MTTTEVIDETIAQPASTTVDSVWMTPGSVKPVWLAVSILATLAGLFSFWPLLIAGAVACLLIAWSWLSEARAQTDELPLR
ncbi:MAG: hypothetical protein HY827_03180 [Actinobacteria bacterium]|nr:hypothetical protein [Actinomycetota bacterium]